MKRIAAFMLLLVVFSAVASVSAQAEDTAATAANMRRAHKAAKQQETVSRKLSKKQRKAIKKYNKAQRKAAKKASRRSR